MSRVLIIEDELVLAKNVRDKLKAHGFKPEMRHSCADGLAAARQYLPDVILLDIRLPDGDGLDILPTLLEEVPSARVIVMTAHGNERIAVDAMKAGAYEYLSKPVELDELVLVVQRSIAERQVNDNLDYVRQQEESSSGLASIIGESPAIAKVKNAIARLIQSNVLKLDEPPTVLITGETGTGKDLAARAIHYDGPRRKKPFIQVNCTALPATLFESELFGHVKGAFTSANGAKRGLFEVAEGGTIFLDEIGHLELDLQAKLLQAIEHREIRPVGATETHAINVHIIAATNRDLNEAVDSDEFRRDLFHRLRVVQFHLPPLRERSCDIRMLADFFLKKHCGRFKMPLKRFSAAALERMDRYAWHGNVRELSHLLESAILQADDVIDVSNIMLSDDENDPASMARAAGDVHLAFGDGRVISVDFDAGCPPLEDIEAMILTAAFEHTNGNLSRAARILGITREALRYRLNKAAENANG